MARHRVTKVSLVADVGGFVRDVRTGKTETSQLRREAERFSKGRYGATLKADTSQARTELSALEKRLQAFGKTPVEGRVNLDTDEARDRLRSLQTRLSEFGTRVSDVRLGVDDAEAQGKISRVEASLLALGRRTAEPDIDVEGIAAAEAELSMLTGRLQRLDGNTYEANVRIDGLAQMTKSASLLVDTVTMLGPALVPVAAAAAGPVAALTSGMTGAAAAGGSALLAFQGVGEALKALDEGDPEKIAEAMEGLNGAGRSFVRFLDNARPELNQLQNVARSGMFPGMEAGLRDIIALGPQWERIVSNSSRALGQLAREGGDALRDPFWRNFFDYIATDANRAMIQMGRSAGNVAEGIAGMVMALDPAADDFSGGLLRMTRRFSRWGRTLETNDQFQKFVRYVQRVSPEVWSTLGAVADAMLEIAEAAAPIGEATLPLIRGLANAIGAVADTSFGPALIGIAAGFALLNRSLRTIEAVKASSLVTFFTGVNREGEKASKAMRGVSAAAGGLIALTLGAAAIREIQKATDDSVPGLGAMEARINGLGRGKVRGLGKEFNDLAESIRRTSNKSWSERTTDTLQTPFEGLFGEAGSLRQAKADLTQLDTGFAQFVEARGPLKARAQFEALAREEHLTRRQQRWLISQMPEFRDALENAGSGGREAARGLSAAERASLRLGREMLRLNRRLEGRQTMRDFRNSIRDFNQALRQAPNNVRRGSRAWDDLNERLDGIAASGLTVAKRMHGLNRIRFLQRTRREFVDAADKMGYTRKQAQRLADRLGLVDQRSKIQIFLREKGLDEVTQKLRRVKERADRVPRRIDARVKGDTHDADRDLGVLAKKMGQLDRQRPTPKVGVEKRKADSDIDKLFRDVRRLGNQKANAKVGLDTKGYDNDAAKTRRDLRDLDRTKAVPKAELDDGKARRQTRDFVSFINRSLRKDIEDEPVAINLDASAQKILRQTKALQKGGGRAFGGPIIGPGTGTSDSINARLSHGEHVLTADEVKGAGGHGAVAAWRQRMKAGALPAFAMGGPVDFLNPRTASRGVRAATSAGSRYADKVASRFQEALSARVNELIHSLGIDGGATLSWAKTQVGKPYVWGGVGPGGYDCSGFMSALTNHLMGKPPHSRLFATGSFPTSMFGRGMGTFSIGSFRGSPGHMAGTLEGTNVESSGGVGVRVGGGARGAQDGMFNGNIWHLKPGLIRTAMGGGKGDAGFQGPFNKYERYIVAHESGGDVHANNPSSTALGIGQLLIDNRQKYSSRLGVGPGTFNRQAQIAMMRMYIEDRYGSSRAAYNFHRSHGWYDDGGWLPSGGTARNRSGKPEPVFSASQWQTLKRAITALTMNRGRPITTDWLERMISPAVKDIRLLHREFVKNRNELRGYRVRTERRERALERIRKSDRFERRDEARDKAVRALKAARSGEAIGEDIDEERADVRRSLRRARRSPIGRDALRDYHKAVRDLEKKRSADVVEEATKRTKWRRAEARDALRSERASIRNARDELKKARDAREDADSKEEKKRARRAMREARQELRQARRQPDSVREKRAREEVEQANRRLKKLGEEAKEIEKLEKVRDRAGRQSDAVRELVQSRKKIEDLREERKERRELAREARKAGRADILQREERAEKRLTERIKAQKEARKEATKAAQAYKAAQEAAIESARSETESLRGQVDLFGGFISPRGAQRQVDDAIERITDYAQNMAQLRRLGVSPFLLEQLRGQGPTEQGVRLGNALLRDKAALMQLSESTAALGSLTERVGAVTGDPRFVSNMPWNPTGAVSTRTLNVDIKALDISAIAGEIRRHVRHEIDVVLNAGVV